MVWSGPSICLSIFGNHLKMLSNPVETGIVIQPNQHEDNDKSCRKESNSSKKDEQKEELVNHVGRRVMIVTDSSVEAKFALQWALSHAVQSNDTVLLLHVVKRLKSGENSRKKKNAKEFMVLNAMRSFCKAKRPEVQVEILLVESKDRGPAIIEEAQKQKISLLIMGQKRQSIALRLLMIWAGYRKEYGVVDYCIQNATCMAMAVKKRSSKSNGYLITTKKLKDFWLLA